MVDKPRDRLVGFDGGISRRDFVVGAGSLLLAGGLAASGGCSSTPVRTPKRGGNFRLGVRGGGAGDIIDGQTIVTKPDQARLAASWETLVTYDDNYKLTNGGLAESVTQTKPTEWTIRLHDGIEFNNGKTFGADDVIYSLSRILDPKEGLFGAAGLASIDVKGMKKKDNLTVIVPMTSPDSTIGEQLGQYYNGMVPVGYSRTGPLKWVGTGPFKTQSFTPGQQSVHVRNPNYWRTGQPYFDQVTVIDFAEARGQVNALLSGRLDAITDIPVAHINRAKSNGGLAILVSQSGGWVPLCMAIDLPPFSDNRVRQAMRLIVDRPAMLEQGLSGYGRVANDLFSPLDACYDTSIPQREQDIDKAKSLLRSAGMTGAAIDLHTTNGAGGMVDSAKLFASQAKAAGLTVIVHEDPTYYGTQYLKLPFSVDYWGTRNYLPQVSASMLPAGAPYRAPYNETHWPPKSGAGSGYISLYKQARAEVDPGKRCDLIHQMQLEEHTYGGYIIPFFTNLIDSYSTKVAGFVPSKARQNLDSFGHGYRTIWFS
jgi:peptide/nickel transport system substrate-binding protein